MLVPTIVVFVRTPLGALDPALVARGIHERLPLLTALFCPEHEEPPDEVLERMRIESSGKAALTIRWRPPRSRFPLRVDLVKGPKSRRRIADKLAVLQREYSAAQTAPVRKALARAIECVGFFLSPIDRRGMGWPVALAAAAKLADVGNGIIGTSDQGWMVPDGNEVSWILRARNG